MRYAICIKKKEKMCEAHNAQAVGVISAVASAMTSIMMTEV